MPQYKVRKIIPSLLGELNAIQYTAPLLSELRAKGWKIVVANQRCGWCSSIHRTIVIPAWLWKPSSITLNSGYTDDAHHQAYRIWYICHEVAHALVGCHHKHDAVFMDKLIEICPPESVIFELNYKPRNAKAAGIALDIATELGFN